MSDKATTIILIMIAYAAVPAAMAYSVLSRNGKKRKNSSRVKIHIKKGNDAIDVMVTKTVELR